MLFDDDGSQDGTTALLFLLSDPNISVESISMSYGEAHPAVYIQHIGRKLDEMQINAIPLGAGQDAPLAGSQASPDSNNTLAEWNIYADPEAAKAVFESGLKIYLVPLDATNQVRVGKEDTGQWRAGGKTAQFAADIYDRIFDEWGTNKAEIWDLMAAAIMTNPELCRFQALHLEVVTADGNTAGQTALSSDKEPNVNVCLEPDEGSIKQTLVEVFSSSK